MIPRVLAIAGSDSGGGAGIQADIKTITMLGGHAMTAITAITAQNTLGVDAVQILAPEMVLAQIDAAVRDIGIDAIKVGMIGSAEIAHAVADRLATHRAARREIKVVIDPVMIASSGAVLADAETTAAFERLMAEATLITPNLPELEVLTGRTIGSVEAMGDAACALAERTGASVLAKGGHLPGNDLWDLLVVDPRGDKGDDVRWHSTRIETRHTHGTGCTLSSAIATLLAGGADLRDAVDDARGYVRAAIEAAPQLGAGHGPMGHALGRRHFPA